MRFEEVEKNLSSKIPGYQPRPSQQALAASFEAALDQGVGQLGQGPVGVGKSLAGMVPVISHALKSTDGRVVIATSTIALMEQYVNSDVPLLQEHSGLDFTWAMLKGKGRYVCRTSLNDVEATNNIANIRELREELDDPSHTGDFEHLKTKITDQDKAILTTSADDCPGASECVFGEICFAENAKRKALQSQVIITNTAMLMADLELRKGTSGQVNVLGEYDAVLVDEGHLLENSASSSLGIQVTQRGVESLLSKSYNYLRSEGGINYETAHAAARQALEDISGILMDDQVAEELTQSWFVMNAEPFMDLSQALQGILMKIKAVSASDERSATKRKIIMKQINNLVEKIPYILISEDYEVVRWLETKTVGRGAKAHQVWSLKTSPVDVSDFLREWLFDRVPTIVMSGTLAIKDKSGKDDFEYIQRSLGADGLGTVAVGSPFDYESNQLVYAPGGNAPSPKDYFEWMGWSQGVILELIDSAPDGGALVLYTSRKDMEAAYENLAERLEDRGRNVYMQGLDWTNKELAQKFKDDTTSVLFGLASFGTGFDAKGDTLKTVIISKLPFDVPTDPIFKAKSKKLEKEGLSPFGKLSLPRMAMNLEQYSGRAVRTVTDRAVVAILDQRLTTTAWGRQALSVVPGKKTTSLKDVRAFHVDQEAAQGQDT